MNKLIIAGNGFDLAHGLPTSYNHFMDAFWRDLKDDYNDKLIMGLIYINSDFRDNLINGEIQDFKSFDSNIRNYLKKTFRYGQYNTDKYSFIENRKNIHDRKEVYLFRFTNPFFEKLNKIHSIKNWVDVENEYYQALKEICKDEGLGTNYKRNEVIALHKQFEQVKKLLERYLQKKIVEVYDYSNDTNNFLEIIQPLNFEDMHESFVKELSLKNDKQDFLEQQDLRNKYDKIPKNKSLILNFNYTNTLNSYIYKRLDDRGNSLIGINHIHGELNKNIVFGFGDEMDDDYKLIENMDDNEYLRYFKSFQYVQNSNYKDVLRYVDSEKFQVIIMGHSCGLSDRTLLNTIFEHENCRSIKVFYHQKEDGTDNYTEVIQNISRHFNDKKLMRTKIVEKTLCEPMPQIQLPKKEV
ncbi:MAG: AbiH family protein [Bacteroidota bacterium]